MASSVFAQVLGGDRKELSDVSTVGDVRRKMDVPQTYQAMLNNKAVSDSESVEAYNYVSFTEKVKGGSKSK